MGAVAPPGDLAVPRAALLSYLAGYQSPLQADGAGRAVGGGPATPDHADIQHRLRTTGPAPVGRDSLPAVRLLRAGAVGLLLQCARPRKLQPGGPRSADHQGLLSAPAVAGGLGRGGIARPGHELSRVA